MRHDSTDDYCHEDAGKNKKHAYKEEERLVGSCEALPTLFVSLRLTDVANRRKSAVHEKNNKAAEPCADKVTCEDMHCLRSEPRMH